MKPLKQCTLHWGRGRFLQRTTIIIKQQQQQQQQMVTFAKQKWQGHAVWHRAIVKFWISDFCTVSTDQCNFSKFNVVVLITKCIQASFQGVIWSWECSVLCTGLWTETRWGKNTRTISWESYIKDDIWLPWWGSWRGKWIWTFKGGQHCQGEACQINELDRIKPVVCVVW